MAPRSEDPKLIIRVINFELVQPICSGYINVTDGRTDGRTTYDCNTALALRASRGKSQMISVVMVICAKKSSNILYCYMQNRMPIFIWTRYIE